MANHYLICALYLLSLQAAVKAGEYTKEDSVIMNDEMSVSPSDTGMMMASAADNSKQVEKEPSAEPSKPLRDNNDSINQSPLSSLKSEPLSLYPGQNNPYPSHSISYPGSIGIYSGSFSSSVAYPGPSSTHGDVSGTSITPSTYPVSSSVNGAYPGSSITHSTYPVPSRTYGAYPGSSITHSTYPGPSSIHGAYLDRPNPYSSASSVYPGSSAGYPSPSILNTGVVGISSTPVSMDYVSRYVGPGTVPVVLPDGTLADTPEVIAARAAHLVALQRAQALWYGPKDDGAYSPLKYAGINAVSHLTPGPIASSQLAYPGPLASRHEIPPAAGNAGLLAPGYPSPLATGYQAPLVTAYQGPLAMPTVLPSGYLADTPDVMAAKVAHLSAVVRAHEQAALWTTNAQGKWR